MHGASDKCLDNEGAKCTSATFGECAGEQNTNYVYNIVIEGEWITVKKQRRIPIVLREIFECCTIA